ncbi:MAG: glycosyltransferase family 9 protein [Alphaproteobacteria bacterium]|nr:glycosyltransferase family 9 protein [Alphaproteobacteria bacterium]
MNRILVVRLGALGDFILSFGPFAAIRAHHPADAITLLTTAPFAAVAARAPWFDRVLVDARPAWWDVPGLARLARRLRGFDLVYDLQTSARSNRYFRLAGRPRWSGIAPGCALPHANPRRDFMHTLERQQEQLRLAGIAEFPVPDLHCLAGSGFDLPRPYALLVPGAAAHRPAKRWPVARFAELAALLHGRGIAPVVLGSGAEAPLAAAIPGAVDLTGRTALGDIATLARGAALAVGNDTGPMHLIAAIGCPCVVLFSAASDPALTAPRGPGGAWPVVLREPDLADLTVARVAAALP